MGDNRPARYIENYEGGSRVIYRASALGMCERVFLALSMEYTPKAFPEWFQEVLNEGTEAEPVIRGMAEEKYLTEIKDVGKVLEMEVLSGVWIRGSIDGWEGGDVDTDDCVIFDAKKIRDSGWARYLRVGVEFQANYPFQFSAYMHMWEEMHGVMPGFRMVGGHYEQAADESWSVTEVEDHLYLTPPINLRAIKQRLTRLERLIVESDTVMDIACDRVQFPCPFYYLHDDDAEETPTRPSDDIVAPLLQEYDLLSIEADALRPPAEAINRITAIDKRKKQLGVEVMAWLKASGQESGEVSKVEVVGVEFDAKYLVSPRKGYTVEPGETVKVTIRTMKRDGVETNAKAIKASKPRKEAAPKPATINNTTGSMAPKPAGNRMPPRPDTTGV